jgi:hypothetical protein
MQIIYKKRGKGKTHDCIMACIVTDSIYVTATLSLCEEAKRIAKEEYNYELETMTIREYLYNRGTRRTFVIDDLNLCLNEILDGVIMGTFTVS